MLTPLRAAAWLGLPTASGRCLHYPKPHPCSQSGAGHPCRQRGSWHGAWAPCLFTLFCLSYCLRALWDLGCNIGTTRCMGSSAFRLASACFLALLCQPVLFPDSLENHCSRSLYRQRCTGLTLLLGPEHQALQLMLKSCLAWGSAGEKSPSFDHWSCIDKLLAGLKALQTHLPWAGAFPLSAPPASTQQWDRLVPLGLLAHHRGAAHLQRARSTPPTPQHLAPGIYTQGGEGLWQQPCPM